MTLAELGKEIGVSAAAVSRYERGDREVDPDTLNRIQKLLDIPTDKLLWAQFCANFTDEHISITYQYNFDEVLQSIFSSMKTGASKNNRLQDLKTAFYKLNETGQQIAVQRVEELGKIPEYRADLTTSAPEDPGDE